MSRIAFLTSPDSFWGAEEAGLAAFTIADGSLLIPTMRQVVAEGFSFVIVTEDLLEGREEEARALLGDHSPGAVLLILPGAGSPGDRQMRHLRERFATALGIDVWNATARRAGVEL